MTKTSYSFGWKE